MKASPIKSLSPERREEKERRKEETETEIKRAREKVAQSEKERQLQTLLKFWRSCAFLARSRSLTGQAEFNVINTTGTDRLLTAEQVGTKLFHCRQLRRIYSNTLHLGRHGLNDPAIYRLKGLPSSWRHFAKTSQRVLQPEGSIIDTPGTAHPRPRCDSSANWREVSASQKLASTFDVGCKDPCCCVFHLGHMLVWLATRSWLLPFQVLLDNSLP